VPEAQELLAFSTRGAASDIAKLIASAAANAENNHELIGDDMAIAEIRVDEGPTMKRWRARARGRATRVDKKTCHVSVALKPSEEEI
jgi:ribosomal protein L22